MWGFIIRFGPPCRCCVAAVQPQHSAFRAWSSMASRDNANRQLELESLVSAISPHLCPILELPLLAWRLWSALTWPDIYPGWIERGEELDGFSR